MLLAGLCCVAPLVAPAPLGAHPGAVAHRTAPAPAGSCPVEADDAAKSKGHGQDRSLHYLADVRAAGHACHDRVVFEFEPGDRTAGPAYRAEYREDPVREDGRGRRVEIAGEETLVVRMSPVREARFSSEGRAEPTYGGPDSIRPRGARHVVEVRHVGSFEGVLTWAIGLRERRPFEVTLLDAPPRLVVDVP